MKIMMLGPPGAGKGTVAGMIYKKYMIPQISTGDLFREAIANNTELGQVAKNHMDKGELCPDKVTVKMLKERIAKADCKNGFILDGFPRTIKQAEAIEGNILIQKVINLVVSEKVVLERLTGRRTCRDCGAIFHVKNIPPKVEGVCDKCEGKLYQREDQKPEVIKERLKVYEEQTAPLIDYYKEKGLLVDINGENPLDKIFEDTDNQIKDLE